MLHIIIVVAIFMYSSSPSKNTNNESTNTEYTNAKQSLTCIAIHA